MQPLNPFLSAFFRSTFPAQCTPVHQHVRSDLISIPGHNGDREQPDPQRVNCLLNVLRLTKFSRYSSFLPRRSSSPPAIASQGSFLRTLPAPKNSWGVMSCAYRAMAPRREGRICQTCVRTGAKRSNLLQSTDERSLSRTTLSIAIRVSLNVK